METLNLLLLSLPFWIPALVGLYLVITRPHELSLMAGLLTLKPIVTTPIWIVILGSLLTGSMRRLAPAHFLSLVPGAGLTLIALLVFRPLFSGAQAGSARMLLVLDCARWLNSFLLSLPYPPEVEGLVCVFALLGLTLPTVFAVVAVTISLTTTKQAVP